MNHQGTVRLESDRLILRRFTMKDAPSMFANWAQDPEVTRFLMWAPHPDVDETRRVLADWCNRYALYPDYYVWAIESKALGVPIGCISVNHVDEKTGCMTIGYCLGRKWWHQGIMTEAFRTVIRFLFEEVGAERIEARHDPENPHSGGVMQKSGLQYEGRLRRAMYSNRGITDACIYAILRSEYEEGQKA